jgi:hypothetical protein
MPEVLLDRLEAAFDRLAHAVAGLKEDFLELRYREKAAGYFQRILSHIRSVTRDELQRLVADGEERGVLSLPEQEDLLMADVVVQGRLRDQAVEAYLLAEISSVLDLNDVERAQRRAGLLEKVVGLPVVAVVAGDRLMPEADQEAARLRVWRVLDGRVIAPH